MKRIDQILNVLERDVLERISLATKADNKVLKLSSDLVLKVLLYTIVGGQKATLSALEAAFESPVFQGAVGLPPGTKTRRNSLHDRLCTIPSVYFEQLFSHCVQRFDTELSSRTAYGKTLLRFDTTLVNIGARMLGITFRNSSPGTALQKVKFTIGYDGTLPVYGRLFASREHTSENRTLGPAILDFEGFDADSVAVFDRGLSSRAAFKDINERGIAFVGRLKEGARYQLVCDYDCACNSELQGADGLIIEADRSVRLYRGSSPCPEVYRLIQLRILATGKALWLLTNMVDEPAWLIAGIYRRRWDIEVFFKLLKSLLSFSHMAARNENGLQVILYTTLIAAILIQVYRTENNIKGYKQAVLKFRNELEALLLDVIIIACGGDPQKRTHAP